VDHEGCPGSDKISVKDGAERKKKDLIAGKINVTSKGYTRVKHPNNF